VCNEGSKPGDCRPLSLSRERRRFRACRRALRRSGYFCFGPRDDLLWELVVWIPEQAATGPLYDALADVTTSGGSVRLPFDPSEVIDNLRYERYRNNGSRNGSGFRGQSMARSLYYWMRPFLPVPIRRHIQRAYLSDWKDIRFPRWPVDRTVEQCLERLLVLSMKAQSVETIRLSGSGRIVRRAARS